MPAPRFARRTGKVPRSFIREILKVAGRPDVISFAGGLPHPGLFPVDEMKEAFNALMARTGAEAFQYGPSEGFEPLREWVSERYRTRWDMDVSPDNVIITTGSQQGLDLLGRTLADEGRCVVMERPGYLGAIQAFSYYCDRIVQVPMEDDGPETRALERALAQDNTDLFYAIPNFQNPSGISYSLEKRKTLADLCSRSGTFLVEDDPYGDLRFSGEELPTVTAFLTEGSVLLGTLSKIAAPGLRVGWIVGEKTVLDRLLVAKQAADLHTSTLTQQLAWKYLSMYDIDEHIRAIRDVYGRQRNCMVEMIRRYFPPGIGVTEPEGGMFLWVTLPEGVSAEALFDAAIGKGVAFVPGAPFYVDGGGGNTMRLNFSNADETMIEEGVRRLGACIVEYDRGKK